MKKIIIILSFYFLSLLHLQGQNFFDLIQPQIDYAEIPFRSINNLIIIEVKVNNIPLNLILDTGVQQTILLNIKNPDSLDLKKLKTKIFVGAGNKKQNISAVKSVKNTLNINDLIVSKDAIVYLISNEDFQFSENIGIPIYGFIGGNLLDDFLVEIDYDNKLLHFYKKNVKNYRKFKKFHPLNIDVMQGKPFISAEIYWDKNHRKKLKLLLDTGNSDALWLFESQGLNMPKNLKKISDYFGLGFNGEITGSRVKLNKLDLCERYKFKDIYTALPDSIFYKDLISLQKFDGIIGAEILRRFKIVWDYKGKQVLLKRRFWSYFTGFPFNNSGLQLIYSGKIPIKTMKTIYKLDESDGQSANKMDIWAYAEIVYAYKLTDKIVVNYVRPDSPAYKAGFKKGDILLKINGESVYKYNLNELERKFLYKTGKNLRFLIKRNSLEIELKLENTNPF